jgi:hypothetical protein
MHRNRLNQWARQQYLYDYLLSHPCVDCGESDPIVLDFDHVFGEKKLEVSLLAWTRHSFKTIENEIRKCEVRCANCHRRRTSKEQRWTKYLIKQLLNRISGDDQEIELD